MSQSHASTKIGVVFPQTEFGNDPVAIRDYAQAAEELGYSHILAYDHVLGAGMTTRPNWTGPYNDKTPFHEIFVLFGYLAGLTRSIELVSGVVILPQRQTVLVAKQAAEVDVLSGGRFRLGVGIGWNDVEYEGLNEDFHTRGARIGEQVEVMRALWAQDVINYHGKWHQITDAGINPLPVRRAIPVWMGGHSEATLKRIGKIGDGWFPLGTPDERARKLLDQLRREIDAAGRDPQDVGIEGHLSIALGGDTEMAAQAENWASLGATHLCVNTMRAGLDTPQKHIDAIRRMAGVLGVDGSA